MTYHVQFLLLVLAGWVNCQQQDVIDCVFRGIVNADSSRR